MTLRVPMLICDAFAEECFAGNPAAVCFIPSTVYRPEGGVTPHSARDKQMGEVFAPMAAEMNLSETAFLYRLPERAVEAAKATLKEAVVDGETQWFGLRWFTPGAEVPLCGHATLGAAHALFETSDLHHDASTRESVAEIATEEFVLPAGTKALCFVTLSGVLTVCRREVRPGVNGYEMRFPDDVPGSIQSLFSSEFVAALEEALAVPRGSVIDIACSPRIQYYVVHLKEEVHVNQCKPNADALIAVFEREEFASLRAAHPDRVYAISGLGVLAADSDKERADVISRFFAPWLGIKEDPVTGSWCTVLVPYWLRRDGRYTEGATLRCYQDSQRGGSALCEVLSNGRVSLTAAATTFLQGKCKLILKGQDP